MASLPVIDISPLYKSDAEATMRVARAVDDACRNWGFFYIVGHNIPDSRFDELTAMANRFFSQPQEEKNKIDLTKSKHHRGYGGYTAEQLDPSKPQDWKETFNMGYDLPEDHPDVRAGLPLRGPNVHPDLKGWKELMERHYTDMQKLALQVLRALALAIGMEETFFTSKFKEPLSVFRMINYPALPEEKGRVVCGSHTDYGIITLLHQDTAGGLQVKSLDGKWLDAPTIPGSFVVNIGDMMAMWSNDRYKSDFHRVLNPGVARLSMPFFCEPNPNTLIRCLPHCSDEKHPAKYPPVTVTDWLQKRFKETYAYRSKM